jgi:predicted lipid-binding transport protein (Tim44 family)
MGGAMGAGWIGGAGILGGGLIGGLAGAALGAVGGTLLGKLMEPPKMPQASSQNDQQQQAYAETPALPPATTMPAMPASPVATPIPEGITDSSPPTAEEVAAGQLQTEKKRKGRLSTILTTPKSRLEDVTTDGTVMEKLGG